MTLFVFPYVFKQHRNVTKDLANFLPVCFFDYYFNIIKMHSPTEFEISG